MLTTEELVWDDKGRLRTHAPATYKIPAVPTGQTALTLPCGINQTLHKRLIFQAVGEPPFMLGFPHLACLRLAAVASYPDLQAPATAEEVLRAVWSLKMSEPITVQVVEVKGSAPREAGATIWFGPTDRKARSAVEH